MPNKTDHTLDLSISAAEQGGLPYLGDMAVVRDLIGELGSSALVRLVEVSNGKLTPEEAGAADLAGSTALAKVFLGEEDGYNTVPEWNKAGKIDAFVSEQAEIAETEPVARLATLFLLMVQDMYAAARLMDEGESEDTAKAAIDGSLEGVAALLLGVSFQEYEAEGVDGAPEQEGDETS